MTFSEMMLSKSPRLLNEFSFWNQVWDCRRGEKWDHINEMEFGVKVVGKIGCHFQSRLG
jgi:hypothetical protein